VRNPDGLYGNRVSAVAGRVYKRLAGRLLRLAGEIICRLSCIGSMNITPERYREIEARLAELDAERADLIAERGTPLKGPTPKPIEAFDPNSGALMLKFPSVSAAGRAGYRPVNIYNCLSGKLKTHRHLVWRWAIDTAS
jgi:hypothetical protein